MEFDGICPNCGTKAECGGDAIRAPGDPTWCEEWTCPISGCGAVITACFDSDGLFAVQWEGAITGEEEGTKEY